MHTTSNMSGTLHLYHAAAGSGKTRALAVAYLQLALTSGANFRKILAITFTNKATQEMKERILIYLDRLSKGKDELLRAELCAKLNITPQQLQTQAHATLTDLLYHYDAFAIQTIDAFTQTTVRTFAAELNLAPTQRLLLDERHLLRRCLTTIVHQLPHTPFLHQQLTTLALCKLQQGKAWSFDQELKRMGQSLRSRISTPQQAALSYPSIEAQLTILSQAMEKLIQQHAALAQESLDEISRHQLHAADFAWGHRGVFGYLSKCARGQLPPPRHRVQQAASEEGSWASKKSSAYLKVQALADTTLKPLLQGLLVSHQAAYPPYASYQALQPLRHVLALSTQLQATWRAHCRQEELLPLSQLPTLLQALLHSTSTTFLQQKSHFPYQHFFLDESQDISATQWQGLRLLLAHALDSGHDNLMVGDVKQSIYRWRGGDPSLLLRQVAQDLGPQQIQSHHLSSNWRSLPHIVSYNNNLFPMVAKQLSATLYEEVTTHLPEAQQHAAKVEASLITQAYSHVVQELPKQDYPHSGYVQVRCLPTQQEGEPDYSWKHQAIAATLATVTTLQQQGKAPQDITLLVRDNSEAKLLLEAFLHHGQAHSTPGVSYRALASSAMRLHHASCITLLVAALRYLHDSGEQLSWHTLQHHYRPSKGIDREAVLQDFVTSIPHLQQLPLYSLITRLIHHFALERQDDAPYFIAFKQAALSHEATPGLGSLASFLRWWSDHGHEVYLPMQTTSDAIQIMTIHQVKGLAFDTVIIPFCAWRLDHPPHHPPILWVDEHESSMQALPPMPIYYGKKLLDTHYSHAYFTEKSQNYLEQLNLLYVALTRSISNLYLFLPDEVRMSHVGGLISRSLPDLATQLPLVRREDEGQVIWELGKPPKAAHPATQVESIYTPPSSKLKTKAATTASTLHLKLRDALHPTHTAQGILWHEVMAEITHAEELLAVLDRYVASCRMTAEAAQDLLEHSRCWWKDPLMRSWFDGSWQVHSEAAILCPGSGEVRPDRVLIKGEEVVVLDFKTGVCSAAHHAQVAGYMQQLTRMGHPQVKGYLCYLGDGSVVACA
jgi:ATP-dependent helicase/nuclease subunit A